MATTVPLSEPVERRRLRVRGVVQGVGFRPFVHRLAQQLELTGSVHNDGRGVTIEVEGPAERLDRLQRALHLEAPPGARIEAIETAVLPPLADGSPFRILDSRAGAVTTTVPVDRAPCPDCLNELFEPRDRRWHHPFINCTRCGPRYTITRRLPYDRPQTSMAAFALCPACTDEYHDPSNRRFHAQPNACPACGPRLQLLDGAGCVQTGDPVAGALTRLRQGEIVALKGVGGFHLLCDAQNGAAVARLRQRKQRDAKPLAVLAANPASLTKLTTVEPAALALLQGDERPIVLLPKRAGCDTRLPGVAPGLSRLGVLLPPSPLHWLLFHEAAGRPAGSGWIDSPQPLLLVCTSANPGGEPLVTDNSEALTRLHGLADAFLLHDRAIVVGCDDSVVLPTAGGATFVRRARGFTPLAIRLAGPGPAVLAFGASLKNSLCLSRGDQAFLSQHIGDLDNAATCRAHETAAAHLERLLDTAPAALACDAHPDYFSSRLAERLAAERGVPLLRVQHHHAHIGAVAAEHRLDGPLLGVALDGVGLGSDGTPWGGELLHVEGARCDRLGHLRPFPLPGGDAAAREPWRMAASALHALGHGDQIAARFAAQPAAAQLAALLDSGRHCPPTSSAGRLFDAAAALLGLTPVAQFEGQAAMQLEALADAHGDTAPRLGGFALHDGHGLSVLDLLPLLAELATTPREPSAQRLAAACFHATLIAGLATWVATAAEATGVHRVALAGGCLLNARLADGLEARLQRLGLSVFRARQAPPNDGGIALGQVWVARHQLTGA